MLALACSTRPNSAALTRSTLPDPAPAGTTLPDYAAPALIDGDYDPAALAAQDLIPYRTLTRHDFRAAAPPPDRAPYVEQLGALTCAHLYTEPGGKIMIQSVPGGRPGEIHFVATLVGARVLARMDRGCSWWNPREIGMLEAYVLQHEQIHFALFEIAARRLNGELAALMAGWQATASSQAGAHAQAERKLQEALQGAFARLAARQLAFDEDTSMGHKPAAQARWWATIQAELAATAD